MEQGTMLKSFAFDNINENEMRTFECFGSVEVTDRDGEIVPVEEVYKIMDIWMDRGAPIQFIHTNRNVGKGLNWRPALKDGKKGVLIKGRIYKHYAEDDQVWKGMQNGDFEGLSLGGKALTREESPEGTILRDLIGYEFSIAPNIRNQDSTFTEVNQMAKSKKEEKIEKAEETVMDENPEQGSEDRVEKLESIVTALVEQVAKIVEKISGGPEEESAVEEQKAEEESEESDKEEVEKGEEEEEKAEEKSEEPIAEADATPAEESEVEKSLKKVTKELSDLKKSTVTKVIKGKRPPEAAKKTDKHTEVRKSLKEMAKNGKIDFTELGRQLKQD